MIHVLQRGVVVESDKHQELLPLKGLYHKIALGLKARETRSLYGLTITIQETHYQRAFSEFPFAYHSMSSIVSTYSSKIYYCPFTSSMSHEQTEINFYIRFPLKDVIPIKRNDLILTCIAKVSLAFPHVSHFQ